MATLESRNGKYRVIFRFGGRRHTKSLRTSNARAASVALARLEDNLRRLELGTLEFPDDVNVGAFLLSDGKQVKKQRKLGPRTVGELLQCFLDQIPDNSVEASTIQSFDIHIRHLKRILGKSLPLGQIDLPQLQRLRASCIGTALLIGACAASRARFTNASRSRGSRRTPSGSTKDQKRL